MHSNVILNKAKRLFSSPVWSGLTFLSVFLVLFLAPLVEKWFDRAFSEPSVYRFVNISGEEFDSLPLNWRQLFSEVATNPGRYDPQTVKILRELTLDDIGLVKDISQYVLGSADDPEDLPMVPFIVRENRAKERKFAEAFQYVQLSRLESLGILRHVHAPLELTLPLLRPPTISYDITLVHGSHVALIVTRGETQSSLDNKPVRLPILQVTHHGYEIFSMLRPYTDFDYLKAVGQLLLAQGFDVTITGFKTTPLEYPWALHFAGPHQVLRPDR